MPHSGLFCDLLGPFWLDRIPDTLYNSLMATTQNPPKCPDCGTKVLVLTDGRMTTTFCPKCLR